MSLVERCKKAIAETPGWEDELIGSTLTKHELHDAARAALLAMADPTPEMIAAGEAVDDALSVRAVWSAMIAKAVEEGGD